LKCVEEIDLNIDRYILLKTEQKATGLIKYKVKAFVDYL
jgi:hypothetical protein